MAIVLPAPINLHTQSRTADFLGRVNIGAPTSVGTKSAGNLPITSASAHYTSNNVGSLTGIAYNLPVAFDSTVNTKVLIWAWQFNAPNRIQTDTIENDGIVFRIYSGSGDNYIQFRIGGNNTPAGSSQGGPLPLVVDPQATNFQSEVGTFDPTDVTGYGFANKYLTIAASSSSQVFFVRAFLFDTEKDAANIPKFTGVSQFSDFTDLVLGSSYTNKIHTFVSVAGSIYTILSPFQIGDNGVTETTFDDQGATVLSPTDDDPSDPRFHLSGQAMRVHLSLGASDSAILRGNYFWGTPAAFNLNSSTGATVTVSGLFDGMGQITMGSDVTASGIFQPASGSDVVSNDATINGATVPTGNDLLVNTGDTFIDATVADRLVMQSGSDPASKIVTLDGSDIGEVVNDSGESLVLRLINGAPLPTLSGADAWMGIIYEDDGLSDFFAQDVIIDDAATLFSLSGGTVTVPGVRTEDISTTGITTTALGTELDVNIVGEYQTDTAFNIAAGVNIGQLAFVTGTDDINITALGTITLMDNDTGSSLNYIGEPLALEGPWVESAPDTPSSFDLTATAGDLWAVYDNTNSFVSSGTGNHTINHTDGVDVGTWTIVIHRLGYVAEIISWTSDDGSTNVYTAAPTQLLRPEGGTAYSGGSTVGLTTFRNGSDRIQTNIDNTQHSPQELVDAQQDFLHTVAGLDFVFDTGIVSAPIWGSLSGITYFLNITGFEYDSIAGATPESGVAALLVSSASHSNVLTTNGGTVFGGATGLTAEDIWNYLQTETTVPGSMKAVLQTVNDHARATDAQTQPV